MTGPDPDRPRRSLLGRVVRDPMTHFIVGGVILFAAYAAFAPGGSAPPADPMRIEITADDMRRIALVWLAQGRAIPSADQMRELARDEATQRILAREAESLGLDKEDEIIRRRLAQKMDFLLTDLAALEEPSEDALRTWYAANEERFAMAPRVSFRHLYFSPDKRGADGARDDAAALLPALAGIGPDDPQLEEQADPFMFLDYFGGRTPVEVTKEFGAGFADGLFALEPGAWAGPIRSGYGWHLVWIDALEPGRMADFETVRDAVKSAWLDERYREIRDRAYDEMLSRYTIVLPDLDTIELSRTEAAAASGAPIPQALE